LNHLVTGRKHLFNEAERFPWMPDGKQEAGAGRQAKKMTG